MRVLHVTSTFPRHDGDTTGPYLADLVGAERDLGMEVGVLAPHALGVSEVVAGVPVRRFRYGPAGLERLAYGAGLLSSVRSLSGAAMVPPYLAAMVAAVRSEVRRFEPDVVHAHWWFPAGLAVALSGAPFVVTLHGSDVAIARRLRPMARWVFGRAAAVVAVSEALADDATAVIGVAGIGVAPMPVVISANVGIESISNRRRRLVESNAGLLAVGRLVPEKGFDVLLDAMALAPPGLTVEVIGDGPLRDELEGRGTPGVSFLGALPRTEYHDRLRRARALVVPSRREGLGLVAVEAVLAGVPVVASAVGGLPSVLGAPDVDGGMLVRPGDPAELARALGRVASLPPPGPSALAAAARHQPEAVARRHLALYQEAAGSLRGS